jgi:hypothetical protein
MCERAKLARKNFFRLDSSPFWHDGQGIFGPMPLWHMGHFVPSWPKIGLSWCSMSCSSMGHRALAWSAAGLSWCSGMGHPALAWSAARARGRARGRAAGATNRTRTAPVPVCPGAVSHVGGILSGRSSPPSNLDNNLGLPWALLDVQLGPARWSIFCLAYATSSDLLCRSVLFPLIEGMTYEV